MFKLDNQEATFNNKINIVDKKVCNLQDAVISIREALSVSQLVEQKVNEMETAFTDKQKEDFQKLNSRIQDIHRILYFQDKRQ
jgi:hypothetical protein